MVCIPYLPVTNAGAATRPNASDRRTVAAMAGVVRVFPNTTNWYHNASFVLPLVATVLVAIAGVVAHRVELLGFAAFLAAVTLLMLPVVLVTWRQTATSVVLTEEGIVSLHAGRTLKALDWASVTSIRERETQGNRRWEIATREGERLLLDGELEALDELLRLARRQSRLDEGLP